VRHFRCVDYVHSERRYRLGHNGIRTPQRRLPRHHGIGYAAGPTSVLLSNYFGYDFLSPTTDMVLTLTTSSGPTVVNLVTNGSIVDPNFSFASTGTPVCTGVTQCDPYDVGITKGATFSSLDTINVSFNVPTTVPLPAALWLMLSGIGGLAALARKRKTAV